MSGSYSLLQIGSWAIPRLTSTATLSVLGVDSMGGVRYWVGRAWALPWIVVVLLALITLFAVVAIYRRERDLPFVWVRVVLVGLRATLLLMLLLAMLGWIRYGAKTDLPDLVLAVDISESMAHRDPEKGSASVNDAENDSKSPSSRIERAQQALFEHNRVDWDALKDRYNIKLYTIGERAESIDFRPPAFASGEILQADAKSSRLGQGLKDILDLQRGRPTAAIVLWSDGITTEGPSLKEFGSTARRQSIPVSVVGIGNELPPSDFRLSELKADDVVFVNDLVTFDAQLRAIGMQNKVATVRLTRNGESAVLAEETIAVDSNDMIRAVQLSHRPPREGEFDYMLSVSEAENEVNRENNRVLHRVQVRDETVRVLLVQDQPSYEYRFLKHVLERGFSDPGDVPRKPPFELTTILQDAVPQYAEIDESAAVLFPVRREDLFAYDVVILSDARVSPRGAGSGGLGPLELQHLYDFVVERGGGLVVILGPRNAPENYRGTPLERLLPFRLDDARQPEPTLPLSEGYRFIPTNLGMTFPSMMIAETPEKSLETFDRLAGFYWHHRVDRLKPGTLVLAETRERRTGDNSAGWPLATLQRIGPGRVLMHSFDATHRWRALQGDRYFARYWMQTIRYLSRQKLIGDHRPVELSSNREDYRVGEPVRLAARFFDSQQIPADDALRVMIENESLESTQIELRQEPGNLDRFVGTVNNLKPGRYRATLMIGPETPPLTDDFRVRPPDRELERLQLQTDELRALAEISQGAYYSIEESRELWEDLPPGEPVSVAPLPPRDVWSLPWPIVGFASLFLLLISTEWLLRKRLGLS